MYSIGIDIGATNTDIGLVHSEGRVVCRNRLSSQDYDNATAYINDISQAIQMLLKEHNVSNVQGIGIGAPNGNYRTGAIEANTANLRIKTAIPLGEALSTMFHTRVKLDNDANAAALGELVYGGAKGMRNFIMLTLGTGVGSGIVIDGQLLHGSHGAAGELGHAIVNPNGRRCGCGRQGCVEMYASARGICQNYFEAAADLGNALSDEEKAKVTCQHVGEAANSGDPAAIKAYEVTAYWLGIALSNAVAFSEPEAIFLMGGPTRVGDPLLKPLRQYFNDHLLFLYKGKVDVQFSTLVGNDTAILGAAALAAL